MLEVPVPPVTGRPYVLLSAAMSADGYLDDSSATRLMLSDAADLDEVDELRAASDAILVGAQTIRSDNPGLLIASAARRRQRAALGQPGSPQKVTITSSGDLDAGSRFFAGEPPLVYAGSAAAGHLRARLGAAATIVPVPGSDRVNLDWMLADLAGRGIGRLMVEGGVQVLHQFLAAGLADEFRLAIAPVVVADPAAPRLLAGTGPGSTGPGSTGPGSTGLGSTGLGGQLDLAGVTEVGRMAVLRYLARSPRAG